MKITLTEPDPIGCAIVKAEDGQELFVQSDWDFAGIASTFEWPGCPCGSKATDGTIDCPDCGRPAHALITDAITWIDNHWGLSVEDPGYFTDRQEAESCRQT